MILFKFQVFRSKRIDLIKTEKIIKHYTDDGVIGTTSHPFTGLLICSDCGGKLSYYQRKVDTDKFLKMIEKYTDIEELTVPMINEYIEKAVVHEATGGRKGKDRKQQVYVCFNFIGNCQVLHNKKAINTCNYIAEEVYFKKTK